MLVFAFANPMYLGKYPEKLESELSKYIKKEDMKNIFQKNNYFGLNHYQHTRVKFDENNLLGVRGAYMMKFLLTKVKIPN